MPDRGLKVSAEHLRTGREWDLLRKTAARVQAGEWNQKAEKTKCLAGLSTLDKHIYQGFISGCTWQMVFRSHREKPIKTHQSALSEAVLNVYICTSPRWLGSNRLLLTQTLLLLLQLKIMRRKGLNFHQIVCFSATQEPPKRWQISSVCVKGWQADDNKSLHQDVLFVFGCHIVPRCYLPKHFWTTRTGLMQYWRTQL